MSPKMSKRKLSSFGQNLSASLTSLHIPSSANYQGETRNAFLGKYYNQATSTYIKPDSKLNQDITISNWTLALLYLVSSKRTTLPSLLMLSKLSCWRCLKVKIYSCLNTCILTKTYYTDKLHMLECLTLIWIKLVPLDLKNILLRLMAFLSR